MLINFSNHPYEKWSAKQKEAARVYGDTVDMPFFVVPAKATEEEIAGMAADAVMEIERRIEFSHDTRDAIMVQGEFTLTYSVVTTLLAHHIRVISACSERRVMESSDEVGNTVKKVEFRFERFREYR
ncbi:MAG: hypothetical protein IJU43_04010 [Lachnospiraceae bacterium]|nr:hypothetical protein [Lachnospiraceae bacterium]